MSSLTRRSVGLRRRRDDAKHPSVRRDANRQSRRGWNRHFFRLIVLASKLRGHVVHHSLREQSARVFHDQSQARRHGLPVVGSFDARHFGERRRGCCGIFGIAFKHQRGGFDHCTGIGPEFSNGLFQRSRCGKTDRRRLKSCTTGVLIGVTFLLGRSKPPMRLSATASGQIARASSRSPGETAPDRNAAPRPGGTRGRH
jgi:hypothetical protein